MSQPGRELLCKITELGFFAADFIFGHFLMFFMCPIILIPYADKVHSIMLFWLRPSRQIRPPIYTAKQTKLRRRRVIRFSVLYFVLLVVFIALIAGPMAAKKILLPMVKDMGESGTIPMKLMALPDGVFNQSDETYWEKHIDELNDGSNLTTQGRKSGSTNSRTSTAKSNARSLRSRQLW